MLSTFLKFRPTKYMLELWHAEWDEFFENKLHQIYPNLKQCTVFLEESVIARLHIDQSFLYYTFLFTER